MVSLLRLDPENHKFYQLKRLHQMQSSLEGQAMHTGTVLGFQIGILIR